MFQAEKFPDRVIGIVAKSSDTLGPGSASISRYYKVLVGITESASDPSAPLRLDKRLSKQ